MSKRRIDEEESDIDISSTDEVCTEPNELENRANRLNRKTQITSKRHRKRQKSSTSISTSLISARTLTSTPSRTC